MKVGIITFHHTTNYGATLQAYALWETIKKQGYKAEIIDYRPHEAVRHYQNKIFMPVEVKGRKNFLINLSKYFISGLKKYIRMRYFLISKIKLSKKILDREDLPSLVENEHGYDVVVAGSDQIWCTISIRGFNPSYFLDFVTQTSKCRKVSYAASFGPTTTLQNERDSLSHLIKQFNSISVRDSNSLNIVQNEFRSDATKVLDPTFLTDFKTIIPNRKNKKPPYLLLYFEKKILPEEEGFIKSIADKIGLRIISVGDPYSFADEILMGLGPDEWLFYFKHASFIVTGFYHGTIFSIKFEKQFTTLARESKKNKTQDLLNMIGLTHRLVTQIETDTVDEQLLDIDYRMVNDRLAPEINKSKSYLLEALAPEKKMATKI
ncbi:MAG: polysaccharide pyruvyl transferase family protein [Leptolyngbya sp. SIO1D8]|nr:polysaccharide pyruvyl transferase family protein [Leptolyngbya sp. SIO1D8]